MKNFLKISTLLITSLAAISTQGLAQTAAAPSAVLQRPSLRWDLATAIANEAVKTCEAEGYNVTAVVVDSYGQQQVYITHNAAPPHTQAMALRKAYTISSFGPPKNVTALSALVSQQDPIGPMDGILNDLPNVMFVAGGILIKSADGQVLGGLGVSGSPGGDKDEACANAAIKKFQDQLK